jgi:hypothetical protein
MQIDPSPSSVLWQELSDLETQYLSAAGPHVKVLDATNLDHDFAGRFLTARDFTQE